MTYVTLADPSMPPAVPEPETFGMLLAGLAVLGAAARRGNRRLLPCTTDAA